MANLAIIIKKMGKTVSGSDVDEEFITDEELKKNEIQIIVGFVPEKLPEDIDLVVYSAAHGGIDNPQVQEAKKRGISVVHQAEFQGILMNQFKTKIAVSGSHGKTTTAAMLSYCLLKLGTKLGYMVGTSNFNEYNGGDYLGNDYFIIEADEYGLNPPSDKTPKFNYLNPDIVLTTNIDFDHPDVYDNLQQSTEAYLKFIKKAKTAYLCRDDSEIKRALDRGLINGVTYGVDESSDMIIKNIQVNERGSKFEALYKGNSLGEINLSVFGEKNVLNAAGAIAVLLDLGFELEKVKDVISGFKGSKRRFEQVFEQDGTYLFDDYAHHPEEIKVTIKATRMRFPNKRIIVIFQPHTFSRTKVLLNEFAESLAKADLSLVMPIFASARENSADYRVSELDIQQKAAEIGKDNVQAVSKEELITRLHEILRKGDIIFTMGAGDVYKLAGDIISLLKGPS